MPQKRRRKYHYRIGDPHMKIRRSCKHCPRPGHNHVPGTGNSHRFHGIGAFCATHSTTRRGKRYCTRSGVSKRVFNRYMESKGPKFFGVEPKFDKRKSTRYIADERFRGRWDAVDRAAYRMGDSGLMITKKNYIKRMGWDKDAVRRMKVLE